MEHQEVGANKNLFLRYLSSPTWICDKSPTGAHYWKETKCYGASSEFKCEYCSKLTRLPNSWAGHMERVSALTGRSTGYLQSSTSISASVSLPPLVDSSKRRRKSKKLRKISKNNPCMQVKAGNNIQ